MFYFGDPSEVAQLYITEALQEPGPRIPEGTLEELEPMDLLAASIYVRVAYSIAMNVDQASDEILDAIEAIFDEMFCHLAARSEVFREGYLARRFMPLVVTRENAQKYEDLFAAYAPSAD